MRRLLIRIAFISAPYNDFLRLNERMTHRAWNIRNFTYFCSSNAKSGASKQAVGGKNGGKRFSTHQFFERKTLENRRQDPLSPLNAPNRRANNQAICYKSTTYLFLPSKNPFPGNQARGGQGFMPRTSFIGDHWETSASLKPA